MTIDLNLSKPAARVAAGLAAIAACSLLLLFIVSRFVIGTLSDDRLAVDKNMLEVPVDYFPASARLSARLAASELSEGEPGLTRALALAQRAADQSPYDYQFRLTLASIEEANGDRGAAEATLRTALSLAPNYWDVHYRLGNLLVREGKLRESLDHLRVAVAGSSELLPGTLDLLWRASGGDVGALRAVGETSPSARLTTAQFLLKASRPDEAASVFSGIERNDKLALAKESSGFLNSLIAAGKIQTARALWSDLSGRQTELLSNGSFESDIFKDFSQFDWALGRSEYARLGIDSTTARTGSRSLRIDFIGRDTTRLEGEIKQLTPVRPGTKYTLECYVKANNLDGPEGPKVVVKDQASSAVLASSEAVALGSHDWQRLTISFVSPQAGVSGASAIVISIERKPRFSYDEPTRGTVWFDDFSLSEQ